MVLLEAKASVDAKGNEGTTALFHAASAHNGECAKLLIDAEADVDVRDNKGATALSSCTHGGPHSPGQRMLDGKASLEAQTDSPNCCSLP